jgi:hypothetical protein
MDRLVDTANEFNRCIKFLARVYSSKKKGLFDEEKALRNNKRLAIIVASDPMWMIENCGPFFLRYADIITERKWDELITHDFTEEKKKYKGTNDGVKHSNDAMDSKIEFIKRVFLQCVDDEKEAVGDSVQSMLSAYCTYALIIKGSHTEE